MIGWDCHKTMTEWEGTDLWGRTHQQSHWPEICCTTYEILKLFDWANHFTSHLDECHTILPTELAQLLQGHLSSRRTQTLVHIWKPFLKFSSYLIPAGTSQQWVSTDAGQAQTPAGYRLKMEAKTLPLLTHYCTCLVNKTSNLTKSAHEETKTSTTICSLPFSEVEAGRRDLVWLTNSQNRDSLYSDINSLRRINWCK